MSLLSENEILESNFARRKLGRAIGERNSSINIELFLFVNLRAEYGFDLLRR